MHCHWHPLHGLLKGCCVLVLDCNGSSQPRQVAGRASTMSVQCASPLLRCRGDAGRVHEPGQLCSARAMVLRALHARGVN